MNKFITHEKGMINIDGKLLTTSDKVFKSSGQKHKRADSECDQ